MGSLQQFFVPDRRTSTIRVFIGPPLFSPVEDRGPVDFPMSVVTRVINVSACWGWATTCKITRGVKAKASPCKEITCHLVLGMVYKPLYTMRDTRWCDARRPIYSISPKYLAELWGPQLEKSYGKSERFGLGILSYVIDGVEREDISTGAFTTLHKVALHHHQMGLKAIWSHQLVWSVTSPQGEACFVTTHQWGFLCFWDLPPELSMFQHVEDEQDCLLC